MLIKLELQANPMSFSSGKNNQIGLKLDTTYNNGSAETEFLLDERYSGWRGMVHGGILSTILDDTMAWAVISLKVTPVTVKMDLRYKNPVLTNRKYFAKATVTNIKKTVYEVQASITDESGKVCVQATAVFMKASMMKIQQPSV